MRVARIAIVSGLQVIDNPRAVKEADALAELGFEVTVLSAVNRYCDVPRIAAMIAGRNWHHLPVVDVMDRNLANRICNLAWRGGARVARVAGAQLGIQHPLQLGYETLPLLQLARKLGADLYSLHAEKALWVGTRLVRDGCAVRIDMEDWHTEDGLAQDRATRPIQMMRAAESLLLNKAVHATATSEAMADALAAAYNCARPTVVYNSFPSDEREPVVGRDRDRRSDSTQSIIWFSQTIGPGRGLEALVDAFARLPERTELHLRGTPRPGYIDQLLASLPAKTRARIHVHSQVSQAELLSRLVEHDIGYCGEISDCRNKDVTISNKMFEYMRAGLAIVASDTTGQLEVARRAPIAVRIFSQGRSDDLLRVLSSLVRNEGELSEAKAASRFALEAYFSWKESKARIQAQVLEFFSRRPDLRVAPPSKGERVVSQQHE